VNVHVESDVEDVIGVVNRTDVAAYSGSRKRAPGAGARGEITIWVSAGRETPAGSAGRVRRDFSNIVIGIEEKHLLDRRVTFRVDMRRQHTAGSDGWGSRHLGKVDGLPYRLGVVPV